MKYISKTLYLLLFVLNFTYQAQAGFKAALQRMLQPNPINAVYNKKRARELYSKIKHQPNLYKPSIREQHQKIIRKASKGLLPK